MKARASRKSLVTSATGNTLVSGADLARQWARADLFSPTFGGCICAGGFHLPIDASVVAEDLLIYLADKYRSSGQAALAVFVEEARGCVRDFGAWLAGLDGAALDQQGRLLLMDDLGATLASMSGANGFACT